MSLNRLPPRSVPSLPVNVAEARIAIPVSSL